jgi:hypothetical protein
VEYLKFESNRNMFNTDNIMLRQCYHHLTPHIQYEMSHGKGRTAVKRTPGIGKTVYGALLARLFVLKGKSVRYWERDNIYFFSWDAKACEKFGLAKLVTGPPGDL